MDPFMRWLIRQRLQDGRLPRGPVADVVEAALADPQECDGCGVLIVKNGKAVSAIVVEDWRTLRMHRECFDVWETERVKSPEP
jgi:hypothetical protein